MEALPKKVMTPTGAGWAASEWANDPSPAKVFPLSLGQVHFRPPPGLHLALGSPDGRSSSASTEEPPCRRQDSHSCSDSGVSRQGTGSFVGDDSPVKSVRRGCCWDAEGLLPGGADVPAGDEQRTTLHIRNLPCSFKRRDLMELIDSWGLAQQYDFVYLPLDFRTRRSIGYAFLNFRNSSAAQVCKDTLHGFTEWSGRSQKACHVEWSQTQGYEANLKLIQKSKVVKLCSEFRPVVFENGAMVPFPN